jgi:predicted dehydrogenase
MTHLVKTPVIRVAIAGQGRSGYHIHANWLRRAPEQYRIVAVADELPERRADAEREFGARAYPDWRELLRVGGFDLFVNSTPTPCHVPATLAALKAGFHVVCEKPTAPTVKQFDAMAGAARASRRLLAPFQNNRLQPFFDKLLEIVRSGVLGEIVYVRSAWAGFSRRWDWQTFQCNLGGSLMNTGPHAIDQALQLFGDREEPRVFCRMECRNELGGDADDFCALTLHGRRSPTIEILLSAYLAYPQGEMYHVSGTRGGLTGGARQLRWRYYDVRKAPKQTIWPRWSENRQYPGETLPWVEKTWELDPETAKEAKSGYTLPSFQSGVKQFYDNVHAVLHGREQPLITLPQVRRQIAVIAACRRQNRLPKKWQRWVPGEGPVKA